MNFWLLWKEYVGLYYLTLLFIPVIIFYLITRFCIYLIAWYCERKHQTKIKVGSVKFLQLDDITILFSNGLTIACETAYLSSNLFVHRQKSLISICVNGLRVQGNLPLNDITTSSDQPYKDDLVNRLDADQTNLLIESFFKKWRSYQLLSFFSFRISNFSFNQLGISNFKVKCLVNTTIQDFDFYFESFGKQIITNCNLNGINFKLLNHGSEETCLADLSFSLKWKLKVDTNNILESEWILDHMQLILFDGLPAFTSKIQKAKSSPIKHHVQLERTKTRLLQFMFKLNIKKLLLTVNNFSIQIMKDHGQRVLSTRLDKIEAELEKKTIRDFEFKLNIKEMQSVSRHITLCKINEISFFVQVVQDSTFLHFVNMFAMSEMTSCVIDYNETEINYWVNYLKSFETVHSIEQNKSGVPQHSLIDQYLAQDPPYVRLSLSTNINNLEFSFHPTLSAVKMFVVLERCKLSNVINPDPLLKELSCECLIDSLCCYKSKQVQHHRVDAFEVEKFNSINYKEIPFYLNNIIFKMHFTSLIDLKINCVSNIMSVNIDYVCNVIDHFLNKFPKRQDDDQKSNNQQDRDLKGGLQLKIQLNANSLALFSDEIKANVSTLLFDYDLNKVCLALNQTEIYSLTPFIVQQNQLYKIMEVFEFKLMRNMDLKEILFTFSEEVYFQWTVSFHIKMCNLFNKLKRIKSHFKTRRIVRHSESMKRKSLFNVLRVRLDGNIRLGALLSKENKTMQLCTPKASFTYHHKTKFNCNIESLIWKFDNHDIFDFKQINFQKYPEFESQKLIDRLQYNERFKLESKKNVCLSITIGQIDIKFPYKYDFATTFNEHFITITKWIRVYHKKHPTIDEIRQSSLLISQDLLININKINLVVLDDPFEKNLHVNYCLLEDEYHEGLKRLDCLTKKIAQVKQQKNLSKEKIEELYTALEHKQEMIYIERQIMLKKSPNYSLSSPLFTIQLNNLSLTAMADLTLNTKDKLVNLIRNELEKPNVCTTDVQFSTIWGRIVDISFDKLEGTLRDFKRPMVKFVQMKMNGLLIGAEQEANSRAKRNCYIDTTPNEEPILLLRSMTTLKIFHDLEFDADLLLYTFGTCWEPIIQQLNISFESIIKPSSDPSPALPWYDKMRFLFHGLAKLKSRKFALSFHGSQNPYNQTEFLEIAFSNSILVWQIGKITVFGNWDLFVHTESKYDERRIVHIPSVKINIDLNWICLGNQFDHYSVMPCAANKVPEYSSNHVHDSYRAFRSHNLSVNISIETEQQYSLSQNIDIPNIVFYSSTLRWFEKQKFVFTGYSRLTRRGKLFNNTKPRKQAFTRMFKKVRLTVCLHKLKVGYFSSFSKEYGIEIIGGYLSHSGEHRLSFTPFKDGLKRRPRPCWETVYTNSEVCNVEIWLHRNVATSSLICKPEFAGLLDGDKTTDSSGSEDNLQKQADRFYLLSFTRMCYHRESIGTTITSESIENEDNPIHSLVIHDLKGAWTKDNRDVAVALFDLFIKTEQLRRNLSTDALKGFKFEDQIPQNGPSPNKSKFHQPNTSSPASTMNRGHAASMLQKLIEDTENNSNVVYIEEMESEISNEEPKLKGIVACLEEDVIRKNLLIELVNSQVMLRGIETHGYIIVSAANTRILQKHHKPVWKERTLYSKTTWVGSVECMQYYATMDSVKNDDIVWLSIDNIQQKNTNNLPNLVLESGELGLSGQQSAGGVVTAAIVNPNMNSEESSKTSVELQRIISRCGCQFYYVNFAEDLDSEIQDVPPLPDDNDMLVEPFFDCERVVDSFTFTHPDLNISTNSQQFSMIMDIINNLLCYVEQHRKEAHEKLQRMRFRMLLSSLEEQKGPILKNQNLLREEVRNLIFLERTSYAIHKEALDELKQNGEISGRLSELRFESERNIEACKARIDKLNEELSMLISTFKEAQITEDKIKEREAAAQENGGNDFISSVLRRIEICFKQARWRLTDQTGQLGIAEMELSNFLYTKVAKNDDSVDHTLELGYIKVVNLLPNQEYKIVLQPTKPKVNIPLDHHRALRVYCRESPPVGGISIKEHFEINVIPLTIEVTNAFYKEMFKFFFPERYGITLEPINEDDSYVSSQERKQMRRNQKKDDRQASTALELMSSSRKSKEDIEEKMRQRASKNQNFVYIKIPEVPIRVSYKGNQKKNFEVLNIRDFTFILPTIEYHNQNWTWLDVSMAIKSEFKRRLLPQAFKQKLKPSFFSSSSSGLKVQESEEITSKDAREIEREEEEQKARLLLGKFAAVPSTSTTSLEKSSRFKGSFIFSKKH